MAELRIEWHIRFTIVTCRIRETVNSYDGYRRVTRILAHNCTLDSGMALPVPRSQSPEVRGTFADDHRAPRPSVAAAVVEVAYEVVTTMTTNCRCDTCFLRLSIINNFLFTIKSPITNFHKTKLFSWLFYVNTKIAYSVKTHTSEIMTNFFLIIYYL